MKDYNENKKEGGEMNLKNIVVGFMEIYKEEPILVPVVTITIFGVILNISGLYLDIVYLIAPFVTFGMVLYFISELNTRGKKIMEDK